jgi:hypothetical protein
LAVKAEAKEVYDSAVAAGKSAALLEQKENQLVLQIGTLKSLEQVQVTITILTPLLPISSGKPGFFIPIQQGFMRKEDQSYAFSAGLETSSDWICVGCSYAFNPANSKRCRSCAQMNRETVDIFL